MPENLYQRCKGWPVGAGCQKVAMPGSAHVLCLCCTKRKNKETLTPAVVFNEKCVGYPREKGCGEPVGKWSKTGLCRSCASFKAIIERRKQRIAEAGTAPVQAPATKPKVFTDKPMPPCRVSDMTLSQRKLLEAARKRVLVDPQAFRAQAVVIFWELHGSRWKIRHTPVRAYSSKLTTGRIEILHLGDYDPKTPAWKTVEEGRMKVVGLPAPSFLKRWVPQQPLDAPAPFRKPGRQKGYNRKEAA